MEKGPEVKRCRAACNASSCACPSSGGFTWAPIGKLEVMIPSSTPREEEDEALKQSPGATVPTPTAATDPNGPPSPVKTDWSLFGDPFVPALKGSKSMIHGVNAWVNAVAATQLDASQPLPCVARLPQPRRKQPTARHDNAWTRALAPAKAAPASPDDSRSSRCSSRASQQMSLRTIDDVGEEGSGMREVEGLLDELHEDDVQTPATARARRIRSACISPEPEPFKEPMPSLTSQWQSTPPAEEAPSEANCRMQ